MYFFHMDMAQSARDQMWGARDEGAVLALLFKMIFDKCRQVKRNLETGQISRKKAGNHIICDQTCLQIISFSPIIKGTVLYIAFPDLNDLYGLV